MRASHSTCSALVLALLLVSCRAERHLVFVTEPPGATVRIDGKMVGRTPLDLRFDNYGARRVSILRAGYRRHNEIIQVEPPWYSYFPLDYFSEIIFPFGWEDIHRMEVVLEPQTGEVSLPDFQEVLERAEALRRGGPAGPNQVSPASPPSDAENSTAPESDNS